MTKASPQNHLPRGDHRILYVSDPSSIAIALMPEPTAEQDLRRWVDMVADSGIDMFGQEVFSQGWTAYWKSDNCAYDQRRQHQRFLPLIESGTQPVEVLIDQSHRRGMDFIAGFRMNDGHAYQAREQGLDIAEFIASHPELQLKDKPEGEHYQKTEPLDFSFEQVREFTFGVIEEVARRFDIDGVELCHRDYGYFPVGRGPERAHLMTDLVQKISIMLKERSSAVGRKLRLGARVFSTIDECAQLGLNVPDWISRGLLDYVSPQDTMYNDFNLPYHEWAVLTRASECMLYPGIQPWMSHRARYRLGRIPIDWATSRALAHTMYSAGADGVSFFNHFVPGVWNPPFYPHAMYVSHQLRDPARVARGERHYIFDPTWAGQTGFGADGKCGTSKIKADKLVLDCSAKKATGEYPFILYENLENAYGATLLFRGFDLSQDDELEVRLNGQVIPDNDIRRTAIRGTHDVWGQAVREQDGRKVGCYPEAGWIDFRETAEKPGPAFSTRYFSLPASAVVPGQNCLSVTLLSSAPDSTAPIVIDELEIYVEPR